MLQSNQINGENARPPVKSIPLNSHGKVRVLSFDVVFPVAKEAQEEILLVKLPRANVKIVQIGLTSAQTTAVGEDEDGEPITVPGKFTLINSNIVYNSLNNTYGLVVDKEIKKDVPFTSTGNLVLNLNATLTPPVAVNSDNYLKFKADIPFTTANVINGYVLYIAD